MHILAGRRPARTPNDTAVALAPTPAQPLIVIDPGHGGEDPGAIGVSGTLEKTITLAAAEELRRAIAKTGRYRVALTRTGDRTVSLAARLAFAREARRGSADRGPRRRLARPPGARRQRLCQQPRRDAGSSPPISGNSQSDRQRAGGAGAAASAGFGVAAVQHDRTAGRRRADVRDAGASRAALCPGVRETIPSVLLEMGFLSNRQDEAMLRQPARSAGSGAGDQRRDRRLFRRHQGILHRAPDRQARIGPGAARGQPRRAHDRKPRRHAAPRGKPMRQMTLVAFLQAQNCTNFVGSWRHPEASPDFMTADYYRHIARVLEAGKFHVGFFDDRLAMPDRFGGDHAHTVANGIRCVKMDPITILTVMGMATERLGLGSTCSTTYYEPFHVARVFQTLDLMTNGRAAWNIVTSMNDGEALNMGHAAHGEHDQRYDRADEFLEVVVGHWDSWDDDAIVLDKRTGLFAHPDKVRRLDHAGEYFRSRGPFTVPRSAQGHPVLIQAGQSGRGRRFAARWAELVFVNYHSLEQAQADYAAFKQQIAEAGRDPEKVVVAAGVYTVVAETRAEAEDKVALIDSAAEGDRSAVAAVGGAERRSVEEADRRTVDRGGDHELDRRAGPARPRVSACSASAIRRRATSWRSAIAARSAIIRASSAAPKDVADGMEEWFADARLRRLRGRRLARARRLRGVRALRRPRTATPRGASQRLSRHHIAREPRSRASAHRRVARGSPLTGGREVMKLHVLAGRLLDRHPRAAGGDRQAVRGATGEPARRRRSSSRTSPRSIRSRRCRRWCATMARC